MVWFRTWEDPYKLEWLEWRMMQPDFNRCIHLGYFWAESVSGDQLALVADGDYGRHGAPEWPPGRFRVFRHRFATERVQEETYLIQTAPLEGVFDWEKPASSERYEDTLDECITILNRLLEVPDDLAKEPPADAPPVGMFYSLPPDRPDGGLPILD